MIKLSSYFNGLQEFYKKLTNPNKGLGRIFNKWRNPESYLQKGRAYVIKDDKALRDAIPFLPKDEDGKLITLPAEGNAMFVRKDSAGYPVLKITGDELKKPLEVLTGWRARGTISSMGLGHGLN